MSYEPLWKICLQVEVERVVLYSLRSKEYVTTFRTAKLSQEVLDEMAAAEGGRHSSGRGFSSSPSRRDTARHQTASMGSHMDGPGGAGMGGTGKFVFQHARSSS